MFSCFHNFRYTPQDRPTEVSKLVMLSVMEEMVKRSIITAAETLNLMPEFNELTLNNKLNRIKEMVIQAHHEAEKELAATHKNHAQSTDMYFQAQIPIEDVKRLLGNLNNGTETVGE